ncbi:MAG: MFS transporter [Thermoplasmata archaeon]|nr:MFS transporter [Thermoplasmata archaeon]
MEPGIFKTDASVDSIVQDPMTEPIVPSERRISTLAALSVYSLLSSNRGGLFIVYLPVFLVEARGAAPAWALTAVSVAFVTQSLLAPVAGRWSDRLGRRKIFLLAGEITALPLFLAIPFLPGALEPSLAFFGAEAALAFGGPAFNAFVADVSRVGERGAGYGLLNMTSSWGAVMGFAVAIALVGPFGLDSLFYFVAAVMVVSIGVLYTLVPDLRQPPTPRRQPFKEFRSVMVFSSVVSVRSLGAGAIGTFFGVDALALGASNTEVGLIAIVGWLVSAVVSLPFGRLIDRAGELRGILYGTILMSGGLLLFLFASTWVWFVPGQSFRTAGFALLNPGMLSWVARQAPPGHRAEHLGVFSLINSTLWSLGPLVGAVALTFGGTVRLFGFALGVTVLSILLIELIYRPSRSSRGGGTDPRSAEAQGS